MAAVGRRGWPAGLVTMLALCALCAGGCRKGRSRSGAANAGSGGGPSSSSGALSPAAAAAAANVGSGGGTGGADVTITARDDSKLVARISGCKSMRYAVKPPKGADIPPFVRAASAICRTSRGLAVVQDDVNAIALLGAGDKATALLLPAGEGGRRTFDRGIGNKKHRLDLESCIALPLGGAEHLVALPSGSKKRRRRIALLPLAAAAAGKARLFDARAFYRSLKKRRGLSGARLNIEGAVVLGDVLRLYQRGNSSARKGRQPINGSVEIALSAFTRWLGGTGPLPALGRVRRFELGALRGARWGFTDATTLDGRRVIALFAAEATDDPNHDGAVLGARVGIDDGKSLRWTLLREADGKPSRRKVEGLTFDPLDSSRLIVTTDADDHKEPAEICRVALSGPWR